MFNRSLLRAFVGVAAVSVFGMLAHAETTTKGSVIRHGRFVWHAPSIQGTKASAPAAGRSAREKADIVYDKGSLGAYSRHASSVWKDYTQAPQHAPATTSNGKAHSHPANTMKRK